MSQDITFFGGLDTIGGISVLIGCEDTGIIFDLGRTPTGFFGWQGGAITSAKDKLRNYLMLRCAPPVLNLYDPKYTGDITEQELEALWERPLPRYKNLYAFVSHIHQDHMEFLPFINENITVFMHEEALATYEGVVKSGEYLPTKATLKGLADMESVDLSGALSIRVCELDHDTPGASGILVTLPDGKIFFTGDFRLHGRHSKRVEEKAALLSKENITLLLTEGTTLRYETLHMDIAETNELDLPGLYRDMLNASASLAYVNILCRNIERVADFINVTRECERKLVMDAQTAILWHSVCRKVETLSGNPAVEDYDTIRLLDGEEQSGLPYKKATIREIVGDKSRYAIYLTYSRLGLMSEFERLGEQKGRSHYFHADGNPLNDSDGTLLYWLKNLHVIYHYHGTGGHAIPKMLSRFAATIAPKAVIPLHSVHPSILNVGNAKKILPHYGMTINITDI